eukprot:scaffold15339_cov79-Isochrysis_galbana.AAC.1
MRRRGGSRTSRFLFRMARCSPLCSSASAASTQSSSPCGCVLGRPMHKYNHDSWAASSLRVCTGKAGA